MPQKERVIIVDGNLPLLALLSTLLEAEGYTVEIASSGKEALTLSANFRPMVAFVCVELPVMSGYELTKALRQTGHYDLAIVAMASHENEHSTLAWQIAGFDYVIPKPVNIEGVLTILRANAEKAQGAVQAKSGSER